MTVANPTDKDHAIGAVANFKFYSDVEAAKISSNGWKAVVLFYSALQAVDAYLAGGHGTMAKQERHGLRSEAIGKDCDISHVAPKYNTLERLAKRARYFPNKVVSNDDLVAAVAAHRYICDALKEFVKHPLP